MKGFAKRMMLILTAGCLLCLLLAGCMSDKYEKSEYVGVWKATTGSMGGINVNVAKSVGRLLYPSDAAEDLKGVDQVGRRIIKK
uniref:hypothetical protein n=1 Tax=Mitsuokella multacida TaxID=52226 RepID=UPI004025D8D9